MDKAEFVKSLQVLSIKSGDLVIVKADMKISPETRRVIEETVKKLLPADTKVAILEPGVDIGVLRRLAE